MMADAGALNPADEAYREYERVVDAKYLDQIRTQAKQFSNKLLSRQSGVAECRNHKLQEGRESHQAAYFTKAGKGHPGPAKQEHQELNHPMGATSGEQFINDDITDLQFVINCEYYGVPKDC